MVRQMRVVLGGTFDLLHAGHEALLRAAFDGRPEAVVIGLTTDRFAKESRTRVNPYAVRERNLKRFLAARKWRHARIEPIDDPY
ncbi:MAG: phosphopantetheine adenylyltransferase, partial [Methanobacteriota archaeon]